MDDGRKMKVEYFNEATVIILLYILIQFTSLTSQDGAFRSTVGVVYLVFTFANVAVHVSLMIYDILTNSRKCLKRKVIKQKHEQ